MNGRPEKEARRLFLLGAGVVVLLACAQVFAPFLSALVGAASAALLLAPVYRSWAARAPRHPSAVAAGLTAFVCVAGLVPFALGGWAVAREAREAYPAARAWLSEIAEPGGPSRKTPERWAGAVDTARGYAADLGIEPRKVLRENLDRVGSWAGSFARGLVRNAAFVLLNLAVFAASLFLFLRDGPRMILRGTEMIPLPEDSKQRLLARVRGVLLAVVNGIFAVALLQGLLAWAGFALFGIPFALLLGALCAFFSPIPFVGTALVWGPVVLYLLAAGDAGKAAGLAVWFAVVVGLSDNLVRPVLLGAQTRLPIPLVFIGVIGALKEFGFGGLFIGPLVIALAYGLLDIIRERSRSEPPAA